MTQDTYSTGSKQYTRKGEKSFLQKRFKSRVRHFFGWTLQHPNSPADWASELFKASTDLGSLVV